MSYLLLYGLMKTANPEARLPKQPQNPTLMPPSRGRAKRGRWSLPILIRGSAPTLRCSIPPRPLALTNRSPVGHNFSLIRVRLARQVSHSLVIRIWASIILPPIPWPLSLEVWSISASLLPEQSTVQAIPTFSRGYERTLRVSLSALCSLPFKN
jgi:hypothetical protein